MGFAIRHGTTDGRTSFCGAAVPRDATFVEETGFSELACTDCRRRLREPEGRS